MSYILLFTVKLCVFSVDATYVVKFCFSVVKNNILTLFPSFITIGVCFLICLYIWEANIASNMDPDQNALIGASMVLIFQSPSEYIQQMHR